MGPEVGQLVGGKYRLVRLIGEGGMGSVYEATHELLLNRVALKFLNPQFASRPAIVARFMQEARISANIRSAHVVSVSDVDQTAEGLPYVVMELLEGESLQQCLDRCHRLSVPIAVEYAVQILNGLEVAHTRYVVHRDLKPDNVFVVPQPNGSLLKLLDFGIAKVRSLVDDQPGLTRPGMMMGTPDYMAPEQVISADTVDHRADLFALGVILFEMVSGVRPVQADDPRTMAAIIMSGRVPRLVDVCPGVPQGISDIVGRALSGRREGRFASAAEMRGFLLPFFTIAASSVGSHALQHAQPHVSPHVIDRPSYPIPSSLVAIPVAGPMVGPSMVGPSMVGAPAVGPSMVGAPVVGQMAGAYALSAVDGSSPESSWQRPSGVPMQSRAVPPTDPDLESCMGSGMAGYYPEQSPVHSIGTGTVMGGDPMTGFVPQVADCTVRAAPFVDPYGGQFAGQFTGPVVSGVVPGVAPPQLTPPLAIPHAPASSYKKKSSAGVVIGVLLGSLILVGMIGITAWSFIDDYDSPDVPLPNTLGQMDPTYPTYPPDPPVTTPTAPTAEYPPPTTTYVPPPPPPTTTVAPPKTTSPPPPTTTTHPPPQDAGTDGKRRGPISKILDGGLVIPGLPTIIIPLPPPKQSPEQ
ncbi:MAG: serine/threonine protein kinase [Polyangiaceae bacterium]|nr:serine/threonine protein kinase [Polyangiaceae bacterium]